MKTAESKTTATAQHLQTKGEEQQPFFQQERSNGYLGSGSSAFFSPNQNPQPFFSKPVIQTKLSIGQPGDKYEQEADQMADQVVQRLAENNSQSQEPINAQGQAGLKIQRKPIFESNAEPNLQAKFISSPTKPINHIQTKCADCEQEEKLQKKEQPGEEEKLQKKPIFESNGEPPETQLQTKLDHAPFLQKKCAACAAGEETPGIQRAADSVETPSASPSLESRLSSSRGGGNPLPENTRTQMEGAFGTDFSGVRVHTDSSSVQMNKELGAQAFTHGSDVYFNAGKFDAGSREGQRLLGHELTHVVQQSSGYSNNLQRMLSCPPHLNDTDPVPDGWRLYPNSTTLFHCGFRTILENRQPTPEDPMNECVYDHSGILVDENHPYAGCRGTPDQYDGHGGLSTPFDTFMHTFCDKGGVVQAGLPALITSAKYRIHMAIESSESIPGFLKSVLIRTCNLILDRVHSFLEEELMPLRRKIDYMCALIDSLVAAIRRGLDALRRLVQQFVAAIASGIGRILRLLLRLSR